MKKKRGKDLYMTPLNVYKEEKLLRQVLVQFFFASLRKVLRFGGQRVHLDGVRARGRNGGGAWEEGVEYYFWWVGTR